MQSTRTLSLIVLAASIALVGGALLFQHVGGLVPCTLCLYQRWPYYAAIGLSALALAVPRLATACLALCGIGFAIGLVVALYHAGVELHWLPGPTACTPPPGSASSLDALTAQIMGQKPVRCDEVQWALFGISLAGWNALASAALVALLARGLGRRPLRPVTP